MAVGTGNTSTDSGLSPRASSLTDTPPAKLLPGGESGAHIPKEPFRRRKISAEVKRKSSSSAAPKPSVPAKGKKSKDTGTCALTGTDEVTITRVANPKRVQSVVSEAQTDFDDDRSVRTIVSSQSQKASSTGTKSTTSTETREFDDDTSVSAIAGQSKKSASSKAVSSTNTGRKKGPTRVVRVVYLTESDTQVESNEVGIQHADVETLTAVTVNKTTTVDIGIQAVPETPREPVEPEEPEVHAPPGPGEQRVTSIGIQCEEDGMKSGESPPPQQVQEPFARKYLRCSFQERTRLGRKLALHWIG